MTLADAIVPLALASQLRGHGRHGPGGQLPCGERRVVRGRHTTDGMELVVVLLWCRTSPATKSAGVPPGVQVCRMRGLTEPRLCRNRTPGGNSELRVKAHIPFDAGDSQKRLHAKAPPG